MKKYEIYANFVLVFHVVFFLLLLASLPLAFFVGWYGIVVGVIVMLTVLQWRFAKGECIFTIIENHFRAKSSKRAYQGSCIAHYLEQWFSIKVQSKSVDIFLYFYFLLIILAVLVKLWP